MYYDKETNLPYKGFFYDVLQGFGKQLNRTIELVPVPDFFTDLDITAFMSRRIREGMIDFGWSNRADFGRDVAENMSYAGVWQFDHYVAVGKKTTRERSGYTQFLEPFSNGVWFTILGSISLGGLVITVLLMNNNHMNNEFKDKHLKEKEYYNSQKLRLGAFITLLPPCWARNRLNLNTKWYPRLCSGGYSVSDCCFWS